MLKAIDIPIPALCDNCEYNLKYWRHKSFVSKSCEGCQSKIAMYHEEYDRLRALEVQCEDIITKRDIMKSLMTNVTKKLYHFITLRPPPDKSFAEFKDDIDMLFGKLCTLTEGHLSFEQTGDSEKDIGKGFHVHILIEKYQKKSYMIRQLVRQFKYIASQCIDVKEIKSDQYNNVFNYIQGEKEESKKGAVAYNNAWRKANGLLDVYPIGLT